MTKNRSRFEKTLKDEGQRRFVIWIIWNLFKNSEWYNWEWKRRICQTDNNPIEGHQCVINIARKYRMRRRNSHCYNCYLLVYKCFWNLSCFVYFVYFFYPDVTSCKDVLDLYQRYQVWRQKQKYSNCIYNYSGLFYINVLSIPWNGLTLHNCVCLCYIHTFITPAFYNYEKWPQRYRTKVLKVQ